MTTIATKRIQARLRLSAAIAMAGLCLMMGGATAQQEAASEAYLQASPERMAQWRDLTFGLFIHWDPSSLLGVEISWQRGKWAAGKGGGQIPVDVYDALYKSFYPAQFDAKEWVALAKAAGMKYLVFTSKHHDGFAMFDSALTDYKITNSPFKRDVVKELADACHEAQFPFGLYYSPPDWHHPDHMKVRHDRYIEYLHGQLRELCTNYGRIDIIWFDGLGARAEQWDAKRLFKMIRELQPDVVINNRAGLPGDFDTPEQKIGGFRKDRPWETCMTIGTTWAWKSLDTLKSTKQCIQTLVNVVGGDGNFLFNVGPMPTGEIEPNQAERLKEMGAWLGQYGESIYGVRGGPFKPGKWGASVYKDDSIYIHVLDWEHMPTRMPPIEKRILSAELITGGKLHVNQASKGITITVPEEHRQAIDTIIKLKIDGPADEIAPVAVTE